MHPILAFFPSLSELPIFLKAVALKTLSWDLLLVLGTGTQVSGVLD